MQVFQFIIDSRISDGSIEAAEAAAAADIITTNENINSIRSSISNSSGRKI